MSHQTKHVYNRLAVLNELMLHNRNKGKICLIKGVSTGLLLAAQMHSAFILTLVFVFFVCLNVLKRMVWNQCNKNLKILFAGFRDLTCTYMRTVHVLNEQVMSTCIR